MNVSDLSIKRPVFAIVVSLLIAAFGFLSYVGLPLRELPDIDPPVVSVQTSYPGAAANVVETRITQLPGNGRQIISVERPPHRRQRWR